MVGKRWGRIPVRFHAMGIIALSGLAVAWMYGGSGGASRARSGEILQVHRGDYSARILLTGTLKAMRAEEITVPRIPNWMTKIRWMVADGTLVQKGQKILELDDSAFAGDLEDKKLNAQQISDQIQQQEALLGSQLLEKANATEEKRIAVEKARIAAAVPIELQPRRDYDQHQLDLARAQTDHAKSAEELDAFKVTSQADIELRKIELRKALREIRIAEEAVRAMTISAPRSGIAEVGRNLWEDRKFQVGDSAWSGIEVMRIPDLSKMTVEAKLYDVDDGRIAPQLRCYCTLDTFPREAIPGVIASVTPIARESGRNPLLRSFRVLIELVASDPVRMRPGMSVKVEVPSPPRAGVLMVPRAALDLASSPPRARLASGGWAEVQIGSCAAMDCVLEGGLGEGTRLGKASGAEP